MHIKSLSPGGAGLFRVGVVPWLWLILCVAVIAPIAVAEDQTLPMFDVESIDEQWEIDEDSGALSYSGDEAPDLVINKQALRQRGVTLQIEGNMTGVAIESAGHSLTVGENYSAHRFSLNRSVILHNTKNDIDASSVWRTLLRDGNSPVAIFRFVDGERVTIKIKYDNEEDEPNEDDADDTGPGFAPDGDNPLAINRVNGMLLQARKSLFNIELETVNPTVSRLTFAVLLSEDGFAITQFHALRSSAGGVALVPGLQEPVPIELWAVHPELDLALIKLPSNTYDDSGMMHVLPIDPDGPESGEAIWALGMNDVGQPWLSSGEVHSVLPYAQLDTKVRRALPFEPLSYWMKTTAQVNSYTSGGPIINSEGRLVGISVWTWTESANSSSQNMTREEIIRRAQARRSGQPVQPTADQLGLISDHVLMMLRSKPARPLTFERAGTMYALTNVPHTRMPQIETTRTGSPEMLLRAANHFHNSSTCPLCNGVGEIEATGRNTSNRSNYDRDDDSDNRNNRDDDEEEDDDDTVECPRCEGVGFTQPEALLRLGSNIVTALSTTDLSHPQTQRAFIHLESQIKESLETNPQRLAIPLNKEARKYLNRTTPNIGTPVIFMGALDTSNALEGQPGRPFIVSLGDAEPRMVVTNTVMADYNLRNVVIVGGLLSGFIADERGNLVPVIEDGFAFNVPEEGDADNPFGQEDEQMSARDRFRQFMMQRMQSRGGFNNYSGR